MRISRPSRVMPALLTRMEIAPNSFHGDRVDQRLDFGAVGHVELAAVAAQRRKALADGLRAGCRRSRCR